MTRYRFNVHHHHTDWIDKGLIIVRTRQGFGLAVELPGPGEISIEGHEYDAPTAFLEPARMHYTVHVEAATNRWWVVSNFDDLFRHFAQEQAALDPARPELGP